MSDEDYRFGLTRVFFRAGKFAAFDQLVRSEPEHLKAIVDRLSKWLVHYRWKKMQYGVWEVVKCMFSFSFSHKCLFSFSFSHYSLDSYSPFPYFSYQLILFSFPQFCRRFFYLIISHRVLFSFPLFFQFSPIIFHQIFSSTRCIFSALYFLQCVFYFPPNVDRDISSA